MSEETVNDTPKRGGWPKGKPRKPKAEEVKAAADRAQARADAPKPSIFAKMKARPNWESDDYVGVGMDGVDRLNIPQEVLSALHRDGVQLQWVTKSVRGMETPQELSKMTRGGWTPVHQPDFDGILDGMFLPKGQDEVITVDDCMLVARPVEIHAKSKMIEKRDASRPVQIIQQQMGRGIPNVTGADHPTATRGNFTKTTVERIEIPE